MLHVKEKKEAFYTISTSLVVMLTLTMPNAWFMHKLYFALSKTENMYSCCDIKLCLKSEGSHITTKGL